MIYQTDAEDAKSAISAEARKHLGQILKRELPYTVSIYGTDILIESHHVYPPGKLSEMFARFLVEKVGVDRKTIIDVGAGCSSLGLVLGKNGASKIVSVDVNEHAVNCGSANISIHGLTDIIEIIYGDVAKGALGHYDQKFDLVISGPPWETISSKEFLDIPEDQQDLYRSFFDVEDGLMHFLLNEGFNLLKKPETGIYTTASLRVMPRIKSLLKESETPIKIDIMAEEDIHKDGNLHYILKLTRE